MGLGLKAQTPTRPIDPAGCGATTNKNVMTITGNTAFSINTLADFSNATPSGSTININVNSDARYRIYVAGEITGTMETTEVFPTTSFSVVATVPGNGPAIATPLAQSRVYQMLVESPAKAVGQGQNHVLTITRNPLLDFKQAPGSINHTLYLHFLLCLY
jgi:hypothetical protein